MTLEQLDKTKAAAPKPGSLGEDTFGSVDADAFVEQYDKVAKSLGYSPTGLQPKGNRARLLAFLDKEHIEVYDYQAVRDHLAAIARSKSTMWDIHRWSWVRLSAYHEPIPFPVLLTAAKIHDALGTDVELFVSQIKSYPDPFLAVRARGDKEYFVVERWDEPTFRDTTKVKKSRSRSK